MFLRLLIFGTDVMLITSWNVNSIRARKDHVIQYLSYHKPDILMLQELKVMADDYPFADIEALGYQSYMVGQKTYNGVAIITKRDIRVEHEFLEGDSSDEQARFIQILDKETGWRFIDIYLPNGNPVTNENGDLDDKFLYKLSWLQRLYRHLGNLVAEDKPFLIGGDWNIAPKIAIPIMRMIGKRTHYCAPKAAMLIMKFYF